MTKETLIKKLREYSRMGDVETAHFMADEALLKFINDEDIQLAFYNISKWYA
jgi:hypothetical protein